MFDTKELRENIERILKTDYGKTLAKAQTHEKYNALSKAIMGTIVDNWDETEKAYSTGKAAYYLSAEFLMGRALGNNLLNLGIYEEIKELLKKNGI
ncbi:hypothetical protein M918_08515 [Clostridium sp. BL8]|nr:hypothetical protein M918_08515 [Clostridium sp. BL8]